MPVVTVVLYKKVYKRNQNYSISDRILPASLLDLNSLSVVVGLYRRGRPECIFSQCLNC